MELGTLVENSNYYRYEKSSKGGVKIGGKKGSIFNGNLQVKYISYLERGFMLQKCYNFSRNRLASEKKMKWLYLTSATLLLHPWEHPDMGRVVENLVVTKSGARFFWRKGTSEVDCVLVSGDEVVPLVSKYKNNIRKKDIKGLLKFMETFSVEKGFVVTKDREGEELVDGKWIVFVPLWKWLPEGRKSS